MYGAFIYSIAIDGPKVSAAGSSYRDFLSTDSGITWSTINDRLGIGGFTSLTFYNKCLFAGTSKGVFRSTENGASWTASDSGIINTDIRSFAVSYSGAGDTDLIAGTPQGVYCSTNSGKNWGPVKLNDLSVLSLVTSGRNVFAGTNNGFFHSTNGGASWNDSVRIYVSGLSMANSRYLKNPQYLTNCQFFCLLVKDDNLFAGTSAGVFVSTNGGTTWIGTDSGLTKSVTSLISGGANLFASSEYPNGIFISTNSGGSWTEVGSDLRSYKVITLAFCDTCLFAGTYNGVFRLTDNGKTWHTANAGLPNTAVSCFAVSGTYLFAGTGFGVYLSTNDGTSWTAVNTGLPHGTIRCLIVSGENLFAGCSGTGVWRLAEVNRIFK